MATVTNQFVQQQKDLLNNCVVKFQFQKTDGSIRTAVGTTNLKFIPEAKHPKNPAATSDNTIPFYDLESGSWKSMQINAQFMHLKNWKSVPKDYKKHAKQTGHQVV